MSITEKLYDPSSGSVNLSSNASNTKESSAKSSQTTQSMSTKEPPMDYGNIVNFIHSYKDGMGPATDTVFACNATSEQNAAVTRVWADRYKGLVDECTTKIESAADKNERVNWARELYDYGSTICAANNVKNVLSEEDCERIWKAADIGFDTVFSNAAKLSQKEVHTICNCGDAQSKVNISVLNKEACKAAHARMTAQIEVFSKVASQAQTNLTSDTSGHIAYTEKGEPHELFWAPGWSTDIVEVTRGDSGATS